MLQNYIRTNTTMKQFFLLPKNSAMAVSKKEAKGHQQLITESSCPNLPAQLVSWKGISIHLTAFCVQSAAATQASMLHP